IYFCLCAGIFLSQAAERSRVPSRHFKRQDYSLPAYQSYPSGYLDNELYPTGPGAEAQSPYANSQSPGTDSQSPYALFKKAEDDRKPVMFPAPPPSEETTLAPTRVPARPSAPASEPEQVAPSERYVSLPKNYAFSYSVKDQSSGDDFSHSQAHNGQSTKGEYRVKLPDGRMQIVSYTADNSGYRADVRYVMDETPKNNFDEKFPNYVHDFTNNGHSEDNSFDQYRDNHIRDYNPSLYFAPTVAPSVAPASTADPNSINHVNSPEYLEDYQVYNPQPGPGHPSGLSYYAESTPSTPAPAHLKQPKELVHDVNYLLNLVTPTKHSLPLYQHAAKLKNAQVSYETTTQNTELDNELYGGKYNYNPVKIESQNSNKNQGMRYHYESMTTKYPGANQGQGFRPSLQSYYAPSALVHVEPPNLGPAQPIQANYVTLPRDKIPYKYPQSFVSPNNIQDSNYQANSVKNSEVKQSEKTTTEESLTMRPHIKYNTKPAVLQNSKPQKST
ncbi:uncharacterized protein LOC113469340, partial [Diaphorina citri]|uniref:Uncharacterized protein LOC113469340 n=1 Tax=Diaphorina citri TaxID=121845 RepID=A0A3Q0J2W7_DIACI